jgi:hypothetical protein
MPESIHKLQPNRTLALRGFDHLGAAAALHSATATSFKVSGVFRDPADFAVLILHDMDNFYEHPRCKHLPDSRFDGIKLDFDVHYTGLMPLDSPKYRTIDWSRLDYILDDATGTRGKFELFPHATKVGGNYTRAEVAFTIVADLPQQFDRVTLWYMNLAYDYIVPKLQCAFLIKAVAPGHVHTINIAGQAYTYSESAADGNVGSAAGLAAAINASPDVTAWLGDGTLNAGPPNLIWIKAKRTDGSSFNVQWTNEPHTLTGISADSVAQDLANQINNTAWAGAGASIRVSAQVEGPVIRIRTQEPGVDGNMLRMYATSKNSRLATTQTTASFTGGSSDATWHIHLDFSALDLTKIRQMWLTFAPALANGEAFEDAEWEAVFTNWTVSDNNTGRRKLQVAGPESVRVEENESWCKYSGAWTDEMGFYSGGFAKHSATVETYLAQYAAGVSITPQTSLPSLGLTIAQRTQLRKQLEHQFSVKISEEAFNACPTVAQLRALVNKPVGSDPDTITIRYTCQSAHDLYLGTSLYTDRATVAIRIDSGQEQTLDCKLDNEPAISTRRLVKAALPSGDHTVTIRVITDGHFYFDFLEAVVATDLPDPLPARTNISPALDYSTDHTFKLSPSRLLWIFDNLGYAGPMNEYIGVFWWNQRKRIDGIIPSVVVTFSGAFADKDQVILNIGGQPCGKTTLLHEIADPSATHHLIARHFEYFINANYVGVWAKAEGPRLVITARSPEPAYSYSFEAKVEKQSGSTGALSVTGSLEGGIPGRWVVDPDQSPALNKGAEAWHRDFFSLCAERNREVVVASSMELVHPPEGFAAEFPGGAPVETSVGFGDLTSTHCAFVPAVRNYQAAVFHCIATWMKEAGLQPAVQFGEYLWWFFANGVGMAFHHADIEADAQFALGRPLRKFTGPDDNPSVNNHADAIYLRNRLRDHVAALASELRAAHPGIIIELLFPYDVNHPTPKGVHNLGGALNRFVNLPVEWESKPTSPFDRIKMEALDFGAWSRNLDLARTAIEFPLQLGWPRDSVRHLVPIFRSGYAWEKEVAMATGAGIPCVNLWAFDHICLFALPPVPESKGRSMRIS